MLNFFDKRHIKRAVFFLLTAAWCVIIFLLSAQAGDESSETSGGFIGFFCELIVPEFSGFDGARRAEFVESLQFIVRKCAHFSAYFLLALLSVNFFNTFEKLKKPLAAGAAAFGFAFIYAAGDELHQLFVPGRSAQLRDVLIDSCGALCGLLLAAAVRAVVAAVKKRKNKSIK